MTVLADFIEESAARSCARHLLDLKKEEFLSTGIRRKRIRDTETEEERDPTCFASKVRRAVEYLELHVISDPAIELHGTKLIHNMLHALDNYVFGKPIGGRRRKMNWTGYQRKLQLDMIATRFEFIYGTIDYKRHREEIHKYWGVPLDFPKWLLWEIPRRHGKTNGHGPLEAIFMYFLPGDRILLLSIGGRVSNQLMKEYIIPSFMDLPGAEKMVVSQNTELFAVRSVGADEKTVTELYAHPSGGQVRGFNAYYVVLEEAAHSTLEQFSNNIMPHLQIPFSAFLAISSSADDDSRAFAQWATLKDKDGKPSFSVNILKRMCDECAKSDKKDCEHAHLLDPPYERPPWVTEEQEERLRAFFDADPDAYRREILGLKGNKTIKRAGTQKEIGVLIEHVDRLKRMPAFQAAHIRLIIESNLAWCRSRDIYQAMLAYRRPGLKVPNMQALCTNDKANGADGKKIGFWLPPDPEHKYRLALHFQSILHTGRLHILDKFVSKNENIMDILRNQLSSFELIPRPNQTKNDFAPRRFEVSGKRGGKKDDVMMSLIEVAFYSAVILFEPHLSQPFQARRVWTIERFKEAAPDIYRRQVETLYVR